MHSNSQTMTQIGDKSMPNYYHVVHSVDLPHTIRCSWRETKPVLQWRTGYMFWYDSRYKKRTLLGLLHVLTKCLGKQHFHSQTLNASPQHEKILGKKFSAFSTYTITCHIQEIFPRWRFSGVMTTESHHSHILFINTVGQAGLWI